MNLILHVYELFKQVWDCSWNAEGTWLKSNKISINADKTKYMLFSYNKNVNFPDISVCNNTINETSVTKFLGIHIDKKLNFVNHITELTNNGYWSKLQQGWRPILFQHTKHKIDVEGLTQRTVLWLEWALSWLKAQCNSSYWASTARLKARMC